MNDILRYLVERASEYWHRRTTVAFVAGGTSVVVLYATTGAGSHAPSPGGWGFVALALIGPLLLWYVTNRLPRVPKGKVGIVLAISCDDEAHDRQVRADFIQTLRQLLERDADAGNFHLVTLPRHIALEIDGFPDADRYLVKARGHFMLFGRVRKRPIRGQTAHLLNFEGLVRHAPVPDKVRHDLSEEFTKVIPRRVVLQGDAEVFAFEATSEWTDVSARYIIALAALISGAVAYAERLLLDVEQRLRSGRVALEPLRQIAQRLPDRFRALYEAWVRHLANRYTLTRERAFVEKADEITTKLLRRHPRHSGARLMKAICEFVLRHDVAEARRSAYAARRFGDVTWRYSVAFLDAYEGNLGAAEAEYQRAFSGLLEDVTVPVQCEEFIQLVLDDEPDKVQLHYCSGLINFYAKNDVAGALRDFRSFVQGLPDGAFQPQQRRATELICQCDEMLRNQAAV
jgi:hypothetical protein